MLLILGWRSEVSLLCILMFHVKHFLENFKIFLTETTPKITGFSLTARVHFQQPGAISFSYL